MFEQTFVDGVGKTNKSWTVLLSFVVQILLLVIAVILPMIYFDVLPKTQLTSFLVAPPPPPPPPPPPAAAAPVVKVRVIPRQFDAGRLMAPKSIPKEIAQIKEEELPPPSSGVGGVVGGVAGGVAGGTPGGVLGGIIGAVPTAVLPPPPPPKKEVTPPLAKQARIQGVVKLSAIIAKDGTIQHLEVISGHPLLIPSALEAVKQWVYQPTLLNGEPVEVVTQIDVNFTLSQ
jgi:protein TonB